MLPCPAELERRNWTCDLGSGSGAATASGTCDLASSGGDDPNSTPAADEEGIHHDTGGVQDLMPGPAYAALDGDDLPRRAEKERGARHGHEHPEHRDGADQHRSIGLGTSPTVDTACRSAPLYSAAAASGTAASDSKRAGDLPRIERMVRRRIVGKQRRPHHSSDDAPPTAGSVGPCALVPTAPAGSTAGSDSAAAHLGLAARCTTSTRARTPASPASLGWDAAAGNPPDRGP